MAYHIKLECVLLLLKRVRAGGFDLDWWAIYAISRSSQTLMRRLRTARSRVRRGLMTGCRNEIASRDAKISLHPEIDSLGAGCDGRCGKAVREILVDFAIELWITLFLTRCTLRGRKLLFLVYNWVTMMMKND